jgi:hypothetical protein
MVSDMKNEFRLQSAMEYLMTYGWAILVIAVVLGVLFQLGVFSSSSFSVRAPPGACRIFRSAAATALVGQCSGVLPQYVGVFSSPGSHFVSLPGMGATTNGLTQLSAFAWFYLTSTSSNQKIFTDYASADNAAFIIGLQGSSTYTEFFLGGNDYSQSGIGSFTTGAWHQIGITWMNANAFYRIYLDGSSAGTFSTGGTGQTITSPTSNGGIGAFSGGGWPFNGFITNAQLYNASLTADEVQILYSEGMGGAPIFPMKLISWWPLNGDAKDYGGNNNNGVPSGLSYVSQYGK